MTAIRCLSCRKAYPSPAALEAHQHTCKGSSADFSGIIEESQKLAFNVAHSGTVEKAAEEVAIGSRILMATFDFVAKHRGLLEALALFGESYELLEGRLRRASVEEKPPALEEFERWRVLLGEARASNPVDLVKGFSQLAQALVGPYAVTTPDSEGVHCWNCTAYRKAVWVPPDFCCKSCQAVLLTVAPLG